MVVKLFDNQCCYSNNVVMVYDEIHSGTASVYKHDESACVYVCTSTQ